MLLETRPPRLLTVAYCPEQEDRVNEMDEGLPPGGIEAAFSIEGRATRV